MILFIKFLLAHLLGDFVFQPREWVEDKQKKKHLAKSLYKHLAVHAVLLLLIVQDHFGAIALIVLLHGLIDIWKLHYSISKHRLTYFIIDQVLHIFMLRIISEAISPYLSDILSKIDTNQILIFATCLLCATQVSSIIIKEYLSRWTDIVFTDTQPTDLLSAGRVIGILERAFVFFLIISNKITMIGFLIGAKSVFRFGDLQEAKNRQLTEYVLVGTMLSFGLAALSGLAYLQIYKLIYSP